MPRTDRARAKRMSLIAAFMALLGLAQAGIFALDTHEAGRGTSETLGQILDAAIADGSITVDHDGLNAHLAAIDPALAVTPGDDPGAWLQAHWIGPRVRFLGASRTLLSVCIGLAFLVFAWWAWPGQGVQAQKAGEPAP